MWYLSELPPLFPTGIVLKKSSLRLTSHSGVTTYKMLIRRAEMLTKFTNIMNGKHRVSGAILSPHLLL